MPLQLHRRTAPSFDLHGRAETKDKKNYKQTLNLPQTELPHGGQARAERARRLAEWEEGQLYEQLLDRPRRRAAGKWVLHDGPPFANGDIHIGHLINKTLKDVILRFRTMQGYQTPYVPGWDCHGLPIEHKIQEELQRARQEAPRDEHRRGAQALLRLRRQVRRRAERAVPAAGHPRRLGQPVPDDEAGATRRARWKSSPSSSRRAWSTSSSSRSTGRSPTRRPWPTRNWSTRTSPTRASTSSSRCSTRFGCTDEPPPAHLDDDPWTLPANLAIAVNPEGEYALRRITSAPATSASASWPSPLVDARLQGPQGVTKLHGGRPEEGRTSWSALGLRPPVRAAHRQGRGGRLRHDHRAPKGEEPGTGLVHTAPGHGEEDYLTGIANGLEVYSPVLANGRFDDTVPDWLRGMLVWDANPVIVKQLHDLGVLFAEKPITHSYPHDWRSKTPTIFRATEQWFVALDKPFTVADPLCPLPGHHGYAEKQVRRRRRTRCASGRWTPSTAASTSSPTGAGSACWACSSPAPTGASPASGRGGCRSPSSTTRRASPAHAGVGARGRQHFKQHGSDAWFTATPAELLGATSVPAGLRAGEAAQGEPTSSTSGSRAAAVGTRCCRSGSYLHFPADLYLEGSDQHRGWFQLSLLPSLGATGRPPFKQVLTHGFVVKPDGTKVSKSDKDYVKAVDEINRHGADLLRLWCSSVDYQGDIADQPSRSIKEFGDKYRKIRNTLRYLLSNLYDFDPPTRRAADAAEQPRRLGVGRAGHTHPRRDERATTRTNSTASSGCCTTSAPCRSAPSTATR